MATAADWGKWYFSEGKARFGNKPSYIALNAPHEKLHTLAKQIVDEHIRGNRDAATKLYKEASVLSKEIITHLDGLKRECGVLVGVCADLYTSGRLAGEKAVKILRGAKLSSLSIDAPTKFDVIINMKTAREGKFPLPSEFMKRVTKKIE
jgi:ABC-type uncharacterized transport system substrate-binding protein